MTVLDFCHELTALSQNMYISYEIVFCFQSIICSLCCLWLYHLLHKLNFKFPLGEILPNTPTSSPAGSSTSKFHIPSEHHLSLPIRRYISDTVINQLLGQPSHSLACILMVSVEALGVVVTKDTPITLEDVCKMVRDVEGVKLLYTLCDNNRPMKVTNHQSPVH